MYRATTARRIASIRQAASAPHRSVHVARSTSAATGRAQLILVGSLVGVGALVAASLPGNELRQDQSKNDGDGYESQSQLHKGKLGSITPSVFAWGRNSYNVAAPGSPDVEMVKKPKLVVPFNGAILRDLVIAETYGAAVDKKGSVYIWGSGFDASSEPRVTLQHHDIVKLIPTANKLFCLSRKGEAFVIPSALASQQANEQDRRSSAAWWKVWASRDPGTDIVKLTTDSPLASGEKIVNMSAGDHHLLALTSAGRSFALPLDLQANAFGQLGVRRVQLLSLHPSALSSGAVSTVLAPPSSINEPAPLPAPPAKLDPLLLPVKGGKAPEPLGQPDRAISAPIIPIDNDNRSMSGTALLHEDGEVQSALERDIRFATVLHEIPSLKGVVIAELAAGARHSLARLADGRVLGWGANGYGQLGLGATLAYPCIAAPTEIPLARNYPKATRIECSRVAAGGNLTYFVVDRTDVPAGTKTVDLLATGNGQFGGIGNGTWAHAPSPVKVKTISGLSEYNDASGRVEPIRIREISAGNAHVAIVLDNAVEQAGGVKFGRDVFVWGHNMYHQLGTGKRSNLSTPQHLPPLPYTGLVAPPKAKGAAATAAAVVKQETALESGTTSPMPHSRLQLAPEIKVDGKIVEETIVAGDGGSAVYWRIVNP